MFFIHTKSLLFLLISTIFLIIPANPTNTTNHEYNYQTDVSVFPDTEQSIPNDALFCHVVQVIDGDTFVGKINGAEEQIHFIGIDTPENTTDGAIACAYVKDLLEGKDIFLESDIQERDKDNRILAYAYLDGMMVNQYLLQKGYATISTTPPNTKYVASFEEIITIYQSNHLPSPYPQNSLEQ